MRFRRFIGAYETCRGPWKENIVRKKEREFQTKREREQTENREMEMETGRERKKRQKKGRWGHKFPK